MCCVQFPGDQPEYPIIERIYYVQFMFPADTSAHSSHLHNMTQDDFEDLATIPDAEHHELASDVVSTRPGLGYGEVAVNHGLASDVVSLGIMTCSRMW